MNRIESCAPLPLNYHCFPENTNKYEISRLLGPETVDFMLGIKTTTVNQAQLNLIPTYSLATQAVARGTTKQKRDLARFLTDIALYPISATGRIGKKILNPQTSLFIPLRLP